MKQTLQAISFLLIATLLLTGCTGTKEPVTAPANGQPAQNNDNNPNTPATTQAPQVKTLGIFLALAKSWDSDADTDGIELRVQPRDAKGNITTVNGTISAKLYQQLIGFGSEKGDLIQEWTNIPAREENYEYLGVVVQLEYEPDFKPEELPIMLRSGILELTFKTEDGKEYSARDDYVSLKEI
ncbi:MAG: hypothetical protein Q7R47_04540 [Candidatus Diapherotrites archaeon]|nr:hypothetical protein [Candidatus Diapherotrites archaeon]